MLLFDCKEKGAILSKGEKILISKNFKTLMVIDGKEYIFNSEAFNSDYKKCYKFAKLSNTYESELQYSEDFAEELHVSSSAVKNWRLGNNGISDLDTVKMIANKFRRNYQEYLIERKEKAEEKQMKNENKSDRIIDETEKNAVRNIYHAFVDYMDVFEQTAGNTYFDMTPYSSQDSFRLINELKLEIRKSMLDIPKDLYEKLLNFPEKFFWEDETDETNIFENHRFIDTLDNPNQANNIWFRHDFIQQLSNELFKEMEELLKNYRL